MVASGSVSWGSVSSGTVGHEGGDLLVRTTVQQINDMLQKTNTAYAPWTVVEADNKHYARMKVLNTVIAAIEKRLDEE